MALRPQVSKWIKCRFETGTIPMSVTRNPNQLVYVFIIAHEGFLKNCKVRVEMNYRDYELLKSGHRPD